MVGVMWVVEEEEVAMWVVGDEVMVVVMWMMV
jgi:hypothetical protein